MNGSTGSTLLTLIPLIAVFGIMYFVMIRPQKKKQKEEEKMRNNINVGDEIVTIGGIMGRVVSMREDSLVVETGADRSKIRIKRWCIQENLTVHDAD